jgi:hypothetical protein
MISRIRLCVLALACIQIFSACGCQAPVPPVPTLWDKLGVTGAYTTIRDNRLNKFGDKPLKEWKPPKLRIADPKNLESPVPAIKVAAEMKVAEDLAEQKIKALKYLGLIGCGCYDKDGEMQKAFLDALHDCTPCVRLAAIAALTTSADECNKQAAEFKAARENCDPRTFGQKPRKKLLCGRCNGGGCNQCFEGFVDQCGYCGGGGCNSCGSASGYACESCLGKEICKRLEEMAYKQNDDGCWLEPVPAIRSAAAALLAYCRPPEPEVKPVVPEIEGGGDVPEGANGIGDTAFNTSWNPENGLVRVAQPSQSPMISGQITSSLNESVFIQFGSAHKLPVGAHVMVQTQNGCELELIVTSSDVGLITGQLVSANPPGVPIVGANVQVGVLAN